MHWFLKFIFGIKLYMFRTGPLSIIRSFSLYTQQWYMPYRFADSLRVGANARTCSCWTLSDCVCICIRNLTTSNNYTPTTFHVCKTRGYLCSFRLLMIDRVSPETCWASFNPLKPELNPICYLLALLAHHFLHVSRIRFKSLTLRRLMSYIYIYIYIYGAPILDVSRSHTTTQHSR